MFQNQVRMHAWHLIINHCIYVLYGSLQEETLMHSNKIGDEERIIEDDSKESRFWTIVDYGTTRRTRKRENEKFWTPSSGRTTSISTLVIRNRQMGFQVVWDRQKGSRVSLFGGHQMGSRITRWIKGIARWDSKLIKGDRQKGSRVSLFRGRQMGPHVSCLLKGIARWDSKLNKGDRQKGSRISLFGGRQMGPHISLE